ncbi:MAG: SpoIIE family protein phosphatase [Chitinispirillaceae bacterium]
MQTKQLRGADKSNLEIATPVYKLLKTVTPEIQDQMKEEQTSEADLILARKIQSAMIPQVLPAADGMSTSSMYLPCVEISGDQFDVAKLSEKLFAFLIFDVSGHGVSSALLSSLARVLFTNQLRQQKGPRAVIERVNHELINTIKADFFLTAFVGFLDLHDNRLTYSNAGHTYPLIYRKKTHELVSLETQGTCIGLFENGFYEEQSLILNPEDWLVMVTDGIYDAFCKEDSRTGRKLFEEEVLNSITETSPEDFLTGIRKKCIKAQSEQSIEDDITALAVKLEPDSTREAIKKRLNFASRDSVYIQFVRYYEEIDNAVSAVLGAMDKAGYGDDCIRAMKISLPELMINAINHGNKKDYFKKVIVGHIISPREVVVSVLDEGEGFDPGAVPDPTLEENIMKDSGRGLFIARNYCDKIEWNEKGNRVTITIKHEKHKGE